MRMTFQIFSDFDSYFKLYNEISRLIYVKFSMLKAQFFKIF